MKIQEIKELIKKICTIPAPSNHEELRADFVLKYMHENGAKDAFIDEANNVIYEYNCEKDAEILLIVAHTDTVFPDTVPFTPVEKDGRIYCPGVGDDTANLAILLIALKDCLKNDLLYKNIVFAANSGEEGLGNLYGTKALFNRYGKKVRGFIALDGGYNNITNEAVGSMRYRVSIKTEGGHSFGSFGNTNAIAVASEFINRVYEITAPIKDGKKSTYNVGTTSGGTSVNTIAQDASFLLECRSDDREALEILDNAFGYIAEDIQTALDKLGKGASVSMELLGKRPCSNIENEKNLAFSEKFKTILEAHTGKEIGYTSGSTDCNIPLSMGIPAVCFGGYTGHGAHTREEYIEIDSLELGYEIITDVLAKSEGL